MRIARDNRLLAEQRRRKILDLIEQKGQITVRDLVDKFSISAVTARADLDDLSSQGMVVRSHVELPTGVPHRIEAWVINLHQGPRGNVLSEIKPKGFENL